MELIRLIEALSDPGAYPDLVGAEGVIVHQTHISAVFLAGPFAYKIKKPVDLGFVDYRTLERRRHFCEQEVRLNQRLAPKVYLGVVPVTADGAAIRLEGRGDVVEWAVKMERLPSEATLRERLRRGEVGAECFENLARRLAAFHAGANAGPAVAAQGRYEAVAAIVRENLEAVTAQVGRTISPAVLERLRTLCETALADLRRLIEARAGKGVARDGHGDLRLVHIYLFPERRPPDDLVIIDCIEFSDRLRYADPIADIAFPVMDLCRIGRRDLGSVFANAYLRAAGDAEGGALLPFYTAYRAAVRGKVDGLELEKPEIPEAQRAKVLIRAQAHWLLALGLLDEPARRPCLVLVAGLPGTGKSTLARALTECAGFEAIRSDVVRKQLAGFEATSGAASGFEAGIYSSSWTERTYAECLRTAEQLLFQGKRVVVDASFRAEETRRLFLEAAARWCVPVVMLRCRAPADVVRMRLEGRKADASDADWNIFLQLAGRWEMPGPPTHPLTRDIDTSGSAEEALRQTLDKLQEFGLWGAESAHRLAT